MTRAEKAKRELEFLKRNDDINTEALNELIELATPRKTRLRSRGVTVHVVCPNCEEISGGVNYTEAHRYCWNCGQRLTR